MRLKKFDSMNVIPFIDIMLVLLAIVLTFSTFIAQGKIDLKLPNATSTQTSKLKMRDILIDAKGVIYFDKHILSLDELKRELAQLEKQTPLSLKADENTPFKTFVQIIDLFKLLKLEKISIITELKR
ncbi:biopolymer transporter ExbD [Candidatus Marinarcus aquaticus]|uniref:TonB system transport protein ExbD n=1 Tax=Candidatus Marinarcus aquaticus TaxID=2044504 RepID=A0A4Q0XTJ7_9BACT|nr:biopolymer transporter ExbD [Candidatus Marinarcus aquaticus]RXJ60907.1 TonB system transport protein ExbD [Candidatus Marinarcus aquaticus]